MRVPFHRLDRQLVSRQRFDTPAQTVTWMGAMQAQDPRAVQWALGLRTRVSSVDAIEAAVADGSVIRSHVFRGTWQYVARDDVRWMLALVGPRLIERGAARNRQFGLDSKTFGRCCDRLSRALAGGTELTRTEVRAVLQRARIATDAPRLSHILGRAELAGVICGGSPHGKAHTYALLDDRVPTGRALSREQALDALAVRYFRSRGPATVHDFAWWAGLTVGEAREAAEIARDRVVPRQIDGATYWVTADGKRPPTPRRPSVHLLPAFDEYLVAYRDRSAVFDPAHARKINAGGGMLSPVVVIDGRVAGVWTRVLGDGVVTVTVRPFRRLPQRERRAVTAAAERYAAFLGREARMR
jgi:hypothetical protein